MYQSLKFIYKTLGLTFREAIKFMANSPQLGSVVWCTCDLIKVSYANHLKTDLAIHAYRSLKQLIRFKNQKAFLTPAHSKLTKLPFDSYPAVLAFLSKLIPDIEQSLTFALGTNGTVHHRFMQQFEVMLVCLQD